MSQADRPRSDEHLTRNLAGRTDFILTTGRGNLPLVRLVDGFTDADLGFFFAFDPMYRGGVNVTTGDYDDDGRADIVLGTESGVSIV